MNCQNCGAAMTLVAGRDYFRCDYCLSFHFPAGSGEDGVRVVGGASGLDCPVCHESLKDGRVEQEPVQYCQRCRGFLATNPVFCTVVRERRAKRSPGDSSYSFDQSELKRSLDCPKCHQRMDTHPYFGGGRVLVDTCPTCTLIWLDAGELSVIERHNPLQPARVVPTTSSPLVQGDGPDDLLKAWMDWRIVPW